MYVEFFDVDLIVFLNDWINFLVWLFVCGWNGEEVICWIVLDFMNWWNFFDWNWGLLLDIIFIGIFWCVNSVCKVLIVVLFVMFYILKIFGYFECVFIIIRNMVFWNGLVKFMCNWCYVFGGKFYGCIGVVEGVFWIFL